MLTNAKLDLDRYGEEFGLRLREALNEETNPQPGLYYNFFLGVGDLIPQDYMLDYYPEIHPILSEDQYKLMNLEDPIKRMRYHIDRGEWYSTFGSADNLYQVLSYLKPYIDDQEHHFCLSVCELTKEEFPDWRWHKNGEYIGVRKPKCEHLGDEPEIKSVYVFHIHRIKPA